MADQEARMLVRRLVYAAHGRRCCRTFRCSPSTWRPSAATIEPGADLSAHVLPGKLPGGTPRTPSRSFLRDCLRPVFSSRPGR